MFFYLLFYLINPVDILNFSKPYYNLFDLYKMSDAQARYTLLDLLSKHRLKKHLFKISNYLEIDLYELESCLKTLDYTSNKDLIANSTISMGKFADYRHITSELIVCGLLSISSNFSELLIKYNLSARSLITYLITTKKEYKGNFAKKWDKDYESSHIFSYNATKLDALTPNLNKYSIVFYPKQKTLAFTFLPSFKKYKLDLSNTLAGGNKKALIIGNPGVGKTSVVEDFYNDIRKGRVASNLKYNRILNLDLSRIVSLGKQGTEDLSLCMQEFLRLKNTILFLDNLHILYSLEGVDYISVLMPYFENPSLKIIATCDKNIYTNRINKESSVNNIFTKIKIEELNGPELIDFLTLKNWDLKFKLTVPALNFLASSSTQVMFDLYNPQKSLKIIDESVKYVGKNNLILKSFVSQAIQQSTGVVLGDITGVEKKELLGLRDRIKREVVGQESAVEAVVDALIRSVAVRGRDTNKPIASFLFAGPTGVGKTELAKSLSRNFFKGEAKTIRIDMSEYQTPESINRLIGSEDGTKVGILTEAVKENPYNLVLLDELEKASRNVHMLFLQVLDDGRLTDSNGNTISFKNIILIATTNAGTDGIIEDFSKGLDYSQVKEKFMVKVKTFFPPEFLNRFTELILFNPLNKNVFGEVLTIKFNKIKTQFYDSHKISLNLDPSLKNHIIEQSYSKEWGARALERVLEKTVTTSVSKALISGEIKAGDNIFIDKDFVLKYSNI